MITGSRKRRGGGRLRTPGPLPVLVPVENGVHLTRTQAILLVVMVVAIATAIAMITGFRLLPPLPFP